MESKPDYIIIGQGIAGSVLGYMLREHYGKTIRIIDNSHIKSSSTVAAGIFNPITGKRLTKTWMADEIFPFMQYFYKEISQNISSNFIFENRVIKPFDNISELNYWTSVADESQYKNYVNIISSLPTLENQFHIPLGGIESTQSGWMDCKLFLQSMKSYFIDNQCYEQRIISENQYLELSKECNESVIFCEGHAAIYNFLWKNLPWIPAKGEVVTIESNNLNLQQIISKSVFVCPTSNQNQYSLGATYSWNNFDNFSPSSEALNELEQKLKSFSNFHYQVVNQLVGIRPAVKDRRPFLGTHNEFEKMKIFNGFGSKAVSMTPYFAKILCENLISNKPLLPEVNIAEKFSNNN
jgi:glycine/D-amino acid oxidase-like deaminating enzyme